ncbi:hypothetical protein ACGFXC_33350 [Streptomyces sp. NPDC048507]|uniref:hypothetical protein n=1 Tax=Streptomyces sp. NPDC048507 TaxID=3365560 RepID=UPI00371C5DA9
MSNSRRIRLSLTSAVLALATVTALASTAVAAAPADDAAPVAAMPSAAAPATQDIALSDGSVAHVTPLADGTFQAWVTYRGTRTASLDAAHGTARVGGTTYVLNQANGFVGAIESSGWHSESDTPRPRTDSRRGPAKPQPVGTTRDRALPSGAVAHVTRFSPTRWQAWITLGGARLASLDATHPTAWADGWSYRLDAHNGTVTARA